MNPQAPAPTVADEQPVSDLGRRVGRPVAIGAVAVMAALLAWLAFWPDAVAGPLAEAPFTVPATLVVPPDDDGCLDVVAGDGTVTTHCIDELAADRDAEYVWTEARFDADGDLRVFREDQDGRFTLRVDATSGEVLERTDDDPGEDDRFYRELEEPIDGMEPPVESNTAIYTDGDVVRRFDDQGRMPSDDADRDEGEVVLDLQGPPGYWLRDAVLSPDDAWVVVTTPDDRIVVAPVDGSAQPYVWAEVSGDRWVDLRGAIRWDG